MLPSVYQGRLPPNEGSMPFIADPNWTIKNSPYGTTHTSKLRYKIVGSKLMPVIEDNIYPQPVTGRENPEIRSRPLPDKPNHVWPSPAQLPLPQEDPIFRTPNRNGDKFYDAIGHVSKPQNDPLHPFSVLPPVRIDPSYPNENDAQTRNANNDAMLQELMRRLPGSRLPNEPVRFSPIEVSYLMNKMHQELEGYVSQRLKDIYVEMTTFDRKLSGLIHFDDFVFAARKHQLKCDPTILRLIASMFVVPATPNFVNYEKILSFIGASLKSDLPSSYSGPQGQQQPEKRPADQKPPAFVEPHETWNMTPRSMGLKTAANRSNERLENVPPPPPPQQQPYQEPEAPEQMQLYQPPIQQHQPPPVPGNTSPFRDRRRLEIEGNQAKLLSILHEALKDYTREDFNRLVDAFYIWDREKKGTLTVDDIKTVAYRQNLRVTNSVINALLDLCYARWDQYDWRKFVKYIEAALSITHNQDTAPSKSPHLGMGSEKVRDSMTNLPESTTKTKYSPRAGVSSPSSDAARAWFDRFMRLSKALYTVDSKYVGHLPPDDVRWVTNEYNRVYELGLHEADVEEAISVSSTHSGFVNIDSYLRSLSLRGHF